MTVAQRIPPPKKAKARRGEVLLGEDWVAPDALADEEFRAVRGKRGVTALNRSPLARKIILFNLMALVLLVAGVIYLSPFRDGLVQQRERALLGEARMLVSFAEQALAQSDTPGTAPPRLQTLGPMISAHMPSAGAQVFVLDRQGQIIARTALTPDTPVTSAPTVLVNILDGVWTMVAGILSSTDPKPYMMNAESLVASAFADALGGQSVVRSGMGAAGEVEFTLALPIRQAGQTVGVMAMASTSADINAWVQLSREQILEMFVIALLVSVGFSIVLASTIANPLSDMAAAAELGRDRDSRKISPGRVRIPDLTARPDEIGRLSVAMRGMVAALYDRIDANEQFAADVAHEIKNPLASLRSAVGTLRVAKRDDQRETLLEVIEHDVRRLDRLVSDISNASRLDSELVKEEEEHFNLLKTVGNLSSHLAIEAGEKGVEFITDLPGDPISIRGLEGRLAQVFVNLITNAISFCDDGDAVRVWARKRGNRVLVVVEDTGPGIPEQALTKVFKRFYSERPQGQFGNHSGLGLAISKQIVEAHGGVIWAENIRPAGADITTDPLGARFVVGLPV